MPTKDVPVNGAVLAWAREEAGLSREDVAGSLGVDNVSVEAWESGSAKPTRGQFSHLVRLLKRPSAVFFLPKPPTRAAIPTTFRMAPGLLGHQLSDEEVQYIRWTRRLQEFVSWALRNEGEPRVALPRFSTKQNHVAAAQEFRDLLGVSPAEQVGWTSPSEAFRSWRAALESLGVLVVQLSLGQKNVRGFSASDDHAPVVAVNTAYHPTARIFTLFHEVGHLLTRTDSACLRFVLPSDPEVGAERWCERFAAAVLMPEDALKSVAARFGITAASPASDVEAARRVATRFKVSTRAASIRLQELGLAPEGFYAAVEQALSQWDWNEQSGGGGGQPAAEKRLSQLGTRIPEILLDAQSAGRLTRADLADYLRLTTGQVEELGALLRTHG